MMLTANVTVLFNVVTTFLIPSKISLAIVLNHNGIFTPNFTILLLSFWYQNRSTFEKHRGG